MRFSPGCGCCGTCPGSCDKNDFQEQICIALEVTGGSTQDYAAAIDGLSLTLNKLLVSGRDEWWAIAQATNKSGVTINCVVYAADNLGCNTDWTLTFIFGGNASDPLFARGGNSTTPLDCDVPSSPELHFGWTSGDPTNSGTGEVVQNAC